MLHWAQVTEASRDEASRPEKQQKPENQPQTVFEQNPKTTATELKTALNPSKREFRNLREAPLRFALNGSRYSSSKIHGDMCLSSCREQAIALTLRFGDCFVGLRDLLF
jgi:hypothetical protein